MWHSRFVFLHLENYKYLTDMDDSEIKKTLKRLSKLSNEEWNLKWGEHEASFLIDLLGSSLYAEKSNIEDLKSNIKELEKELKEARKMEKEITKPFVRRRKTLLQLQRLLEVHKNIN